MSLLSKLAVFPAKAARLLALLTGHAVIAAAAIPIGLLDPAVDRRSTRFELAGQIPRAAPGTRQGNDLLAELSRVRVPRSRHDDTLLSQLGFCPSNRGNSNSNSKTPSPALENTSSAAC